MLLHIELQKVKELKGKSYVMTTFRGHNFEQCHKYLVMISDDKVIGQVIFARAGYLIWHLLFPSKYTAFYVHLY